MNIMDFAQPKMQEAIHWSWMKWQMNIQPQLMDAATKASPYLEEANLWFKTHFNMVTKWIWGQLTHPKNNERSIYMLQFILFVYILWSSYNVVMAIDQMWFQPAVQAKPDRKAASWKSVPRRPVTRSQTKATKFESQRRRHDRHEFAHGIYQP